MASSLVAGVSMAVVAKHRRHAWLGLIAAIPVVVAAGALTGCTGISFTVTTAVDAPDANPGDGVCDVGDGTCSLRAAIDELDAGSSDVTVIAIAPGVNPTLSRPPSGSDDNHSGDLNITRSVMLQGNGATIDGGGLDGVINHSGGALQIDHTTITHGLNGDVGGGIRSTGNLTLRHVTVTGNQALQGGGVWLGQIDAGATSEFDDVTLTNNLAQNLGQFPGASALGGGLFLQGSLVWHGGIAAGNSVVSSSSYGAAVFGDGMQADHLSIVGNRATLGVLTMGDTTISDSTIAFNVGVIATVWASGGPIRVIRSTLISSNAEPDARGPVTYTSSTVASQTAGQTVGSDSGSILETISTDCSGNTAPQIDASYNLLYRSGCVAPQLGPLADNGGPTFTEMPTAGSLAVDAIPIGTLGLCDGNGQPPDQRDVPRPRGPRCDIGAVER